VSVKVGKSIKRKNEAGHRRPTPIIPATQEAEMEVRSQPRQNSSRDPILKKLITKKGWWSAQGVDTEFKP
jgi:hypothetical protein